MGGWEVEILSVELRNAKLPCHVFLKILIPYWRSSRIDQTDLEHFSARAFSKLSDSQCSGLSQTELSETFSFVFSSSNLGYSVAPESTIMVLAGP